MLPLFLRPAAGPAAAAHRGAHAGGGDGPGRLLAPAVGAAQPAGRTRSAGRLQRVCGPHLRVCPCRPGCLLWLPLCPLLSLREASPPRPCLLFPAEVHCFVSPILQQIRATTSKVEAESWVNAWGGAGWVALEVGMGKTACAVAVTQLNPPPRAGARTAPSRRPAATTGWVSCCLLGAGRNGGWLFCRAGSAGKCVAHQASLLLLQRPSSTTCPTAARSSSCPPPSSTSGEPAAWQCMLLR